MVQVLPRQSWQAGLHCSTLNVGHRLSPGFHGPDRQTNQVPTDKKTSKKTASEYVKIHETEKNSFNLLTTNRRCKLLEDSLKGKGNGNTELVKKKDVFAKFKSYNKESGTGHVITAAPPKNSIPNKKITQNQENENILLKQKANRYTYEGKIINFSFIKKVDRKAVDKKFGMSFADFKKGVLKK
jgi:hypothetical protein